LAQQVCGKHVQSSLASIRTQLPQKYHLQESLLLFSKKTATIKQGVQTAKGIQPLEQLSAIVKVPDDFLLLLHPDMHHADITAAHKTESQQLQGVPQAFVYSV